MKKFSIEIQAGDKVELGRFRNVQAVIKSIETDDSGQPVIVTNKGRKKLFSLRLSKLTPGSKTPRQILTEKKK